MNNFSNTIEISKFFLCLTFFSILISTALTNLFLILSLLFGIFYIIKNKDFSFLKDNKVIQISIILYLFFLLSLFYTEAETSDAISSLKKYMKIVYIPIIYYIIKSGETKERCLSFFLSGCGIILLLSYAKFFNIIHPSLVAEYLDIRYQDKLMHGVTVFQNSIIHGIVLSLFSYLLFLKFFKTNNYFFLLVSFLGFYNVIFLNNARVAYIISIFLIFFGIYKYIKKLNIKIITSIIIFLSLFYGILNSQIILHRVSAAVNELYSVENNMFKGSVGLRSLWIKVGVDNISNKSFLGYGVGSFKKTVENYISFMENSSGLIYDNAVTNNPHNEFVSISSQLGLIGLLFYIALLIYLYIVSIGAELGFEIFIIIFSISFFNCTFYDNILGIFSVLIIAIALQKNYLN